MILNKESNDKYVGCQECILRVKLGDVIIQFNYHNVVVKQHNFSWPIYTDLPVGSPIV